MPRGRTEIDRVIRSKTSTKQDSDDQPVDGQDRISLEEIQYKPTTKIQRSPKLAKDKRDPLLAGRCLSGITCGKVYMETTKRSMETEEIAE